MPAPGWKSLHFPPYLCIISCLWNDTELHVTQLILHHTHTLYIHPPFTPIYQLLPYQELMTPFFLSLNQRQRLSNLTLSALQDTGWYTPRWEFAMRLDFEGLPQGTLGCGLATATCQNFQAMAPGTFYCNSTTATTTNGTTTVGPAGLFRPLPNLACYTPTSPAACDVTPFSNGCGVLHPANLPCSTSGVASKLPPGSMNLLRSTPSPSMDLSLDSRDFYLGFGAAYGPRSSCLSWTNSSDARYAGCFISECDEKGVPRIKAVVKGALVSVPCPPGGCVGRVQLCHHL